MANETYKLAWMLLIAIVPFGGALFYLLFANKRDNKRQRKKIINYNNLLIKYGNYTNRIIALGYEEQFIKNTNSINENRRLEFKIIPYSSKYAVKSYISKVKKKYNPMGVNTVNFNIYK